MSELTEIKEMLSEHIKSSNSRHEDTIRRLASIDVHGGYTKEKLIAHEIDISDLKAANNQQTGIISFLKWFVGFTTGGGIITLIIFLLTHK